MKRLGLAVANVIVAASCTNPTFAESSDGGQANAGGRFMSSYSRGPVASALGPARLPVPRSRRTRSPSSLSDAISMGVLSPSEAASLQAVVDAQY